MLSLSPLLYPSLSLSAAVAVFPDAGKLLVLHLLTGCWLPFTGALFFPIFLYLFSFFSVVAPLFFWLPADTKSVYRRKVAGQE